MIPTDQLKATNEQLRLEIDRLKEVAGEVADSVVPANTDDTDDNPTEMFGIKTINGVPVSTEEDSNEKEMAEEQRRILFPY